MMNGRSSEEFVCPADSKSSAQTSRAPCSDKIGFANERMEIRSAIEKRGGFVTGIDEATLLRFLQARSMNTEKAAAMFVNYQKWRASFVPLGYIPDHEISTELATEKVALQGNSKKGWPLLVGFGSKHLRKFHSVEMFQRFIVYVFDKTMARALPGAEKMMVIIDLKNLRLQNVDQKAFEAAFQLLQDYYPERLGKLFIVNAPKFFVGLWKILSSFLDKATVAKIDFLNGDAISEVLLSEVDAEVLPTIYGGKAPIVLIQDAPSPRLPAASDDPLTINHTSDGREIV